MLPQLKWSSVIAGVQTMPSSPSTGPDATVYIGGGDTLYALYGNTGVVKWSFSAPGTIQCSPAVDSNGNVFFGTSNSTSNSACNMYSLNATTGAVNWKVNIGSPINASPTVDVDDTVYVATYSGAVYSMAGATGAVNWQVTPNKSEVDQFWASPAIDNVPAASTNPPPGSVYVASVDGFVYSINKFSGVPNWSLELGGGITSSPTLTTSGNLYVGCLNHKVYGISNGSILWSTATGGKVQSSPAIGPTGIVYVGSEDQYEYALNPVTGGVEWTFLTGSPIDSSPAVGADGTVYIGPDDGNIYALDGSTGTETWDYVTTSAPGSPSIGADGTLLAVSGTSVVALASVYVTKLSVDPSAVNGGVGALGSVVLNQKAPSGGAYVGLVSANIGVVVPGYVVVPFGQLSTQFPITTNGVDETIAIPITATPAYGVSTPLTVYQPSSMTLSLDPTEIPETYVSTATVTINCLAGPNGLLVYGSGPVQYVFIPHPAPYGNASAIGYNQNSAQFPVTALTVDNQVQANITSSVKSLLYGWSLSAGPAVLTIDPASLLSLQISPATVVGGLSATGTVNLDLPAGPDGTVVSLASSSSSAQVPGTVTVPAGLYSASFTITTSSVPNSTSAEITATLRGVGQSQTLGITPVALASVSLNPTTVLGRNSSTGTVTLDGPAGPGGVVVSLSSNTPDATVSSSVTVAGGSKTATFGVQTQIVSNQVLAIITASEGGQSETATLTVDPPTPASVSVAPSTVLGGSPSVGTVTLNAQAGSQGSVVMLYSNSISAVVPATLTIPAGQISGTFPITTTGVNTVTPVTITAGAYGITQSATLTISPTALVSFTLSPTTIIGGQTSTGVLTLLGPASPQGTTVILTTSNPIASIPSSVTVPSGQTSATFLVATGGVASTEYAAITAKMNGQFQQTLTINAASLLSVTLNPPIVAGLSPSTGTVTLNGLSGNAGAIVSLSSNSKDASVPASVAIAPQTSSATFTVSTTPVTKETTATITGTMLSGSQSATLTLEPIGVLSLLLNPDVVDGGTPSAGTVTLNGLAPKGGVKVRLSSSNGAVSVPGSVMIPEGEKSGSFTAKTSGVASQKVVTITATGGAGIAKATLTVNPPVLVSLGVSPGAVAGAVQATGLVTLSGSAPAGGIAFRLSSSTSDAIVPSSVTIPGGKSSASFAIKTRAVSAQVTATLMATLNGVSKMANLTITPPGLLSLTLNPKSVAAGKSSTATVKLTGPAPAGGVVVSLSCGAVASVPGSVAIPASGTSATFTVKTAKGASGSATVTATLGSATASATLTVT